MRLNFGQQSGQFGAIKLPVKRGWALVGQCFIQGQPEPYGFQIGKVIGGEHLPLDDGEVDFDLIEPTGVDGGMDQDDTGIDLLQPMLEGFHYGAAAALLGEAAGSEVRATT